MTDFDSDFIWAATEYDPNAARESKATRAAADFHVWWEREGYLYGQDRMSMRNAFVAGMIAQLQEERERLLRRLGGNKTEGGVMERKESP